MAASPPLGISFIRTVFAVLGFFMLATLIYTCLTDGSPFRMELLTPWSRWRWHNGGVRDLKWLTTAMRGDHRAGAWRPHHNHRSESIHCSRSMHR